MSEVNGSLLINEVHNTATTATAPSLAKENGNRKLSASEKRKLRAKAKKLAERAERELRLARQASGVNGSASPKKEDGREEVIVEYVSAPREYEDLVNESTESADEPVNGVSGSNGFASAGFVSSSDPANSAEDTPGLGSLTGLGGAGLGATPQRTPDWDTPGLGSTTGLGATPGPSDTPSVGGLGFVSAGEGPKKEEGNPYEDFERIFSNFASAEEVTGQSLATTLQQNENDQDDAPTAMEPKQEAEGSDGESGEDEEEKKSKKKRKLEARLKIADLKQACPRPEVVEVWDVTAQDPKLLVYLKAYRNSVPVPRHWSQKRKYLQGKRGIEKPMFKLPEYIEATGIGEMRQAYHEKEENKKLKSKQREKMQPKMGKLDIDYQVLHDAFFKFQTKPQLTVMGDLYYEGKEYEARVKSAKPGILSQELREALGMAENSPPPWLINMQRYGPPPSYPDLKIAGLNAPIPPGARFGYQPGGWGKPPVDENGEPLYGDVFGQYVEESDDEQVDKQTHWGDLESEEEEESEEEDDIEEDRPEVDTESLADGLSSVVSGYSSLPSGLETPEALDLRKGKAGGDRPLYQVLEQQAATIQQGQLMGTDHTYVIPPADATGTRRAANARKLEALKRDSGADVEVAIDPEELEGLDDTAVKALYEQRLSDERARHSREDFSDMVANKAAQQKRKAAEKKESGKSKKQKDSFQF